MSTTIEDIEGDVWPEPEWQSGLVLAAHALRKKPLSELTPNDLRVAFSQQIGADLVKARALEVLEHDPAAGDLYEGDLLLAVMHSSQFRDDETFRKRITAIADAALKTELDSATRDEIQSIKAHRGTT